MSVTLAFSQQSIETRVANTIRNSRHLNPQVVNPDLIYPWMRVSYALDSSGDIFTRKVYKGDFQDKIVRELIFDYDRVHKMDTIKHSALGNNPAKGAETEEKSIFQSSDLPCFFWVVVGILALVFLGWIVEKIRQSEKQKTDSTISANPTTAGPAFVPGGVSSENATNHFMTLAERSNPRANIVIKNVKPVFISTPGGQIARVEYSDGTHQDRSFRNICLLYTSPSPRD